MSSWVLLGEYQARETTRRTPSASACRTARRATIRVTSRHWAAATTDARNVGGVYGFDRWRIRPSLTLDYGLRVDRYDYVASPELLSPQIGARVPVLPRHVCPRARVALDDRARRRRVPAADVDRPVAAARAHVLVARAGRRLTRRSSAPLRDRRSSRSSARSTPRTILGAAIPPVVDESDRDALRSRRDERRRPLLRRDARQRRRSTAGACGSRRQLRGGFDGAVDYTIGVGRLGSRPASAARFAASAPSVVRPERERLHDLTTSLDADIPEIDHARHAGLSREHRVQPRRRRPPAGSPPAASTIEVHQGLPYPADPRRPARGGLRDAEPLPRPPRAPARSTTSCSRSRRPCGSWAAFRSGSEGCRCILRFEN